MQHLPPVPGLILWADQGAVMSPIVANLYKEYFENRALTSAMNSLRLWKRYVDDTCVIIKQSLKQEFVQHINSVDPSIMFTTEKPRQDGSMPFLDTLVTPQQDGTLTTSVYRKPTHIYLYLQRDSHHNLAGKYSVMNTLTHKAKTVCSNSKLLETELKHLQEVFGHCKYPKWATDQVLLQQNNRNNSNRRRQGRDSSQTNKKCHIVVPYSQGLCENYKNICSSFGVQVHFKGGNTLKNLLMFPKDRDAIIKQSKIIYWFKCGRTECGEEYIGESARTFKERYKEHLKVPSPCFEHLNITGCTKSVKNFRIIAREVQNIFRAIKEAIYIRVSNPTLNRSIGKYNLLHIWNKVLFPSQNKKPNKYSSTITSVP